MPMLLNRIALILVILSLAGARVCVAADDVPAKKDTKEAKDDKSDKSDKADEKKDDKDEKAKPGPATSTTKTSTTKKSGGAVDAKALNAPIAALSKEFDAFAKDPIRNPLRADANYFKDNPSDASPDEVFAVLEKPIKGLADKRGESYVKWQCLALLPEKLDAKQQDRLAKLYHNAPMPVPRPGADPNEQKRLNSQVQALGKNKEFDFNEKFLDAVSQAKALNAPILAYRDALYRRMTPSLTTYQSAFKDAYERSQAGMEVSNFISGVVSDVGTWGMDAKKDQLKQMNDLVTKLAALPPPDVYTGIKASDKGGYEWLKQATNLNEAGRLTNLAKELEERAASASNAPPTKSEKSSDRGNKQGGGGVKHN